MRAGVQSRNRGVECVRSGGQGDIEVVLGDAAFDDVGGRDAQTVLYIGDSRGGGGWGESKKGGTWRGKAADERMRTGGRALCESCRRTS